MAKQKSTPVGSGNAKAKGDEKKELPPQEILYNKRLRHDYTVLDSWEAGLVLMGSEVKSLRAKDVQWGDAHARIERGQAWLYGLHIGEYRQAGVWGHQPQQPRKMLLSRKDIDRIASKLDAKGLTLAPERLLFRRGYAKVVICLCKGKTHEDKRHDLVKKAQTRDVEREMARRSKRGD
jgi:SsrA-binding protein